MRSLREIWFLAFEKDKENIVNNLANFFETWYQDKIFDCYVNKDIIMLIVRSLYHKIIIKYDKWLGYLINYILYEVDLFIDENITWNNVQNTNRLILVVKIDNDYKNETLKNIFKILIEDIIKKHKTWTISPFAHNGKWKNN